MQIRTLVPGLLLCCLFCAAASEAPADKQDSRKYELKYRPAVGQRVAYEQSMDLTVRVTAADDRSNRRVEQKQKVHSQAVVTSDEVLEVRDGTNGTIASAKRLTFGSNCWTATKVDDKPAQKKRLVYADKTVTFKLTPDGNVEQDFGAKPSAAEMRMMREAMLGRTSGLPPQAVAVGERWRNDESMRVLLDLSSGDTVSTFYTLKAIKAQDGRQVAEVRVSAAVIKTDPNSGLGQELSFEGTNLLDLETGVTLKSDVTGRGTISGRAPGGVKVNGDVTIEVHHAGRFLPPVDATAEAK